MNCLKSIVGSAILAFAAVSAYADNPVIRVLTTDDQTIEFNVEDQTRAFYNVDKDNKVSLIISNGNVVKDEEGNYVPADSSVDNLYLCMPVTTIKSVNLDYQSGVNKVNNNDIKVDLIDGKISISNVEKPVMLSIYSLNGIVEYATEVTADRVVDLKNYDSGMHIVSINGSTFKVMVK